MTSGNPKINSKYPGNSACVCVQLQRPGFFHLCGQKDLSYETNPVITGKVAGGQSVNWLAICLQSTPKLSPRAVTSFANRSVNMQMSRQLAR